MSRKRLAPRNTRVEPLAGPGRRAAARPTQAGTGGFQRPRGGSGGRKPHPLGVVGTPLKPGWKFRDSFG